MRALELLLGLAVAAVAHFFGARLLPLFPVVVDLFLVVALLNALDGSLLAALAGGLLAGLATDVLSGGPYGLYGFADTMLAYGTAFAARRLVIRPLGVFLLGAAAAALQYGIIAALFAALASPRVLPPLAWLPVRMLISGVVGVSAVLTAARIGRRLESRRRSQRSRLRLGR